MSAHQQRLRADLEGLLAKSGGCGLTLGQVLGALDDRATAVVLAVFSAPFVFPIPLPGLSTVAGLPMAWLAWRLARGQAPWAPRKLAERKVSHETLEKSVRRFLRAHERVRHLFRERLTRLVDSAAALRVHGLYLMAMALTLALPFPPVFIGSNAIAAWPILLLSLGVLERDGLLVSLAYAWSALFAAYWLLFYFAGNEIYEWVKGWL